MCIQPKSQKGTSVQRRPNNHVENPKCGRAFTVEEGKGYCVVAAQAWILYLTGRDPRLAGGQAHVLRVAR